MAVPPEGRRITIIPPALPAAAEVDHSAVDADAYLQNLLDSGRGDALPAPAWDPSASSDGGCKAAGHEDWC
jgi:hypothetical protein